MALRLLIAGVDRIGYLERGSLRINQDAATYVSTCYFNLIDPNNVITATIKDTIVVDDPALGVVYFDGTVANVDFGSIGGGTSPRRRVKIQCQDNNILIEEAIVVGPHSYVGVADNVIIAALFALYCPAISTLPANVNLVDGAVTIDFLNITLREAMKQLCDRTGGFWFVRASDLYYGVDADFGTVPWELSDTPVPPVSYEYLRDTARKYHGSNMVNEITVIGVLAAAGGVIRQDLVSQGIYGVHAAITTDNRISTVAGGQKRGDAILADWSMPRESYTVKTFPGTRVAAIAGQRIWYTNSVFGIARTLYTIRRLNISFPADTALYTMTLGDDLDLGLLGQRIFLDKIEEALEPIEPMDLPLSSLGWAHNIVFTPTAFDLVVWAGGGTITAADGTVYNIGAGTTPNMGAATVYYIYLDLAISAIALQWNVAAANAVGANRLLVAVCYPSTDVTTDASVQVMAGSGGSAGVFINADNIAANCITAGLIFANTITAGCMAAGSIATAALQAGAITTITIAAGAVTADKLQIGSMFFNDADGLLLLGPHCYIASDEWRTLQQQPANITGAFHQEAGRWIDTRGLIIEVAATNLITNPSFETGTVGWAASGGGSVIAQSQAQQRFGDYILFMNPGGAWGGAYYVCTATTAALTEYTFSAWIYTIVTQIVGLQFWDAGAGAQLVQFTVTKNKWTRVEATRTFGNGAVRNVYILNGPGSDFYADGVQLEETAWSTTYLDGSLGSGYAWTGAAHASTSTRTATQVNLDNQVDLITSNATMSFRMVVQMPYDANFASWPADPVNYLLDIWSVADRILLRYRSDTDLFALYIDGADRVTTAAQTFVAGDWIDIVVTVDFTADDYNIYLNGILAGNDTTALAAQVATDFTFGTAFDGTSVSAFNFAEFAVFDRVLTAAEVAQLYNLQRPLVDAGSIESPGIYIYDGRFRIASSTTGNRIEITPEEIAGYDSAGVKQFYLQSSNGVAWCGAGKIWLNSGGINLEVAAAPGYIRFYDGATARGYLFSLLPGGVPQMYLRSGPGAGAADVVELLLEAMALNTTTSSIRISRDNTLGYVELIVGGLVGGRASYNNIVNKSWFWSSYLSVEDGVTAPAAIAGKAHIYVDSADGDLKVKFGDGFVRTIATDS